MKHGHEVSLAKPRRKHSGRGLAKLRTAHAVVGRSARGRCDRASAGGAKHLLNCRIGARRGAPRNRAKCAHVFSGMYIPVKKTFAHERLERCGCGI